MMNICIIIIYFGKLPNYFQLWLNSCFYNEKIDFLLFIDDHTNYKYPKNIKVIYTKFEEIKKKIQDKYEFNISLEKAYKLCDYRPAYGEIFCEYLSNYDFWGHCDIDLIFGDISKFLEQADLNKYDKIYKYGHFSLYKNNDRVNTCYKKLLDYDGVELYKKVFTTNKSCMFDESDGIVKLFKNKDNDYKMYEDRNIVADILIKYNNLIPFCNKEKGNHVFQYKVEDNKCKIYGYYKEKNNIKYFEVMYVHLQKRMMRNNLIDDKNYYIVPNEFINFNNNKLIEKYINKLIFIRKDYIMFRFNNLKKKLK